MPIVNIIFYLTAALAVLATILVITRAHAVHSLLYLIISLLAIAVIFFLLGAPFVAVLEVIVYAGAIMVLFIFVIMMLNLGRETERQKNILYQPKIWAGPALIALLLLAELVMILAHNSHGSTSATMIGPKLVGLALFGPYLLGVELASMLLLAGLVGAYHLARPLADDEVGKE